MQGKTYFFFLLLLEVSIFVFCCGDLVIHSDGDSNSADDNDDGDFVIMTSALEGHHRGRVPGLVDEVHPAAGSRVVNPLVRTHNIATYDPSGMAIGSPDRVYGNRPMTGYGGSFGGNFGGRPVDGLEGVGVDVRQDRHRGSRYGERYDANAFQSRYERK